MGYLDNTSITVDAILTNKGRELLAQGGTSFNITQFALGDDEVDYTLWNPNDTRGTAFYGDVIENMPVTEAIPDQTKALKYRLLTLPGNNAQYLPKISITPTTIGTQSGNGATLTFNASTLNFSNANSTLGYTAVLDNGSIGTLTPATGQSLSNIAPGITGGSTSVAVVGLGGFNLVLNPNPSTTQTRSTTITFFANETGGEVTVNIIQGKRTFTASNNTTS
jgi:hypothetical protein